MGRAMLILTSSMLVIFGFIQIRTMQDRQQISDNVAEMYEETQANNYNRTGIDLAIRKLVNNRAWRGPETIDIAGTQVTLEAVDYTVNSNLSYGQLLVKAYTEVGSRWDTTRALIRRGGVMPPVSSALGFQSDSLGFEASGKAFDISGHDENFDGTQGPGGSVPGIKTTNQAAYDTVYNELKNASPDQTGNVVGEGSTPSMEVDESMGQTDLDPLVQEYVNNADVTYGSGSYGSETLGTNSDPQISVIESGSDVEFSGGSGAGVMVIQENADFKLTGDFTFNGIIINRGGLAQTTGNVTVQGGFLFGSSTSSYQSLDIEGSVNIQYSTEALSEVEQAIAGGSLDYDYKVLSIYE